MNENQAEPSALTQWIGGAISLRSMILHSVGCLFIGTPEALNMPGDFYYIEGDRNIPHPNEYVWERQRELLFVDTFRRNLTEKLGKWCLALAMAVFLSGLMVQGLTSGVKAAYHQGEKAYNHMFKKEPVVPPIGEMTQEGATSRLQEIMLEYKQLTGPAAGAPDPVKIAALKQEAGEILKKFPGLEYILRGQ